MIKWYAQDLNQCSLPKLDVGWTIFCSSNLVNVSKDGLIVFPPEIVKLSLVTVFLKLKKNEVSLTKKCVPYVSKCVPTLPRSLVHELFMDYPKYPLTVHEQVQIFVSNMWIFCNSWTFLEYFHWHVKKKKKMDCTYHRRTYDTTRIFYKFQDKCPPPTPSSKSVFKTHSFKC